MGADHVAGRPTMTAIPKPAKAQREPLYLQWIRSQLCVITGQAGCVAHHRIGNRHGTAKTSDYEALPLIDAEHKRLHDGGWREWERQNGTQWLYVTRMQDAAILRGLITRNEDGTFTPNKKALKRAVEYS